MRRIVASVLLVMAAVHAGYSQTTAPAVTEDFKAATTNQNGKMFPAINSERRVRARIHAPQATSVQLDIGGKKYPLTKGEDGLWTGESAPQDEGFHYYQLVIDGAFVPDPASKYFYGASRWGSGVEVPAHDQDFYALTDVPHGNLSQHFFYSKSLQSVQRCFVYTPPDYNRNPSQRYPVLYLQHGGGEDETSWGAQGHANLILDNLIAQGKAKPFIIVMASSNVGGPGPGRPRPDAGAPGQTGIPVTSPATRPGAGVRGPGNRMFSFNAFETVLMEELIPSIDSTFRTLPEQPYRAMAGLSMGGMQTRAIAPKHLDQFSALGIFSGGSIGPADIRDMGDFQSKVKLVFVSYGSREGGISQAQANVDLLNQAGIHSKFYVSPETAHEWQSWRRSLYQMATLLFQN